MQTYQILTRSQPLAHLITTSEFIRSGLGSRPSGQHSTTYEAQPQSLIPEPIGPKSF